MAAVAGTETVTITVNDVELVVPKGELIVESVKRLGLEIPIFCYHSRLKPVGMCRMCLVDVGFKQDDGSVRKMPKPQAACTLPADNNMVVYTDTEQVHKDRKGVLEFLLINHPLDCPVCDRGGECPLQNNTLTYGPSTSRFVEMKRHLPKAFPLSKYVTLDLERCIQCGRCVRFTEEISGDGQLAFRWRGASMQPSTYQLTDFDSKFSGNVIEICPVGALTSAKYRFRARPWDLETKPAICTECSNGCNVWFDHRAGKLVRLNGRTNEAVNEEWTCDKGKFGHDWYNSEDRSSKVLVRQGEGFAEANWSEAYSAIIEAFKGGKGAGLVKPTVSNEALFMFKKMMSGSFGSSDIDHRWTRNTADLSNKVSTTIAELENSDSILVFGTDLADEEPIVHLRVRKAWFKNGTKIVIASDGPTDSDSFAHAVLRYNKGSASALATGLANLARGSGDAASIAQQTGVSEQALRQAAEALSSETVVLTTHAILDQDGGSDALSALSNSGMKFNCLSLESNGQGAVDLGLASGKTTQQILEAAASGEVKALWLVGCDPFEEFHDKALVERALENVNFLVVQDTMNKDVAHYASVILPMSAPAEHDGTYTNCERRVQRIKQIVPEPGDAKPAWRIFSECMVRVEPQTPFFNPGEVMQAIAKDHSQFEKVDYNDMDGEGTLLGGTE